MNPVEVMVTSSHSQKKYITGTTMENKIAIMNPNKPKKKRITQEKYIKYLHLYLSQKVINMTPRRAKTAIPKAIP